MHSPATTPDTISAIPVAPLTTTSQHSTAARKAHPGKTDPTSSAPRNAAEVVPTAHESASDSEPEPKRHPAPAVSKDPSAPRSSRRRRPGRWLHHAAANRERGMSTAEYAVGTIAACAFAALLFKVVSSPEVQEMLSSLIDRALNTNG
ncbi:DUF4244 domain-containing protein [Nonomuraea polychroma]|uniref:DUF4244 domain-containing protein n=1 Tax=Nonomuraea polychroma TaxID=46176 RepID=UPI003D89CD85